MDEKGITLIADPRVLKIPIYENSEPLVDLSMLPELVLSKKRAELCKDFSKVRYTVANKLVKAAAYLPLGLFFLVEEGYRPLSVQERIFNEYYRKLATVNPLWDHKSLYIEVCKYVAPPQEIPPHSTGGAIDITLIRDDGVELDMGSTSDETPNENNNRGFTHAENISKVASINRKILIDALSKEGFVNYPTEWWHWSYGDRYWAYQTGQGFAFYGSALLSGKS